MRNWVKTALFTSSFSPALISVAISRWWERGLSDDVTLYGAAGVIGVLFAFLIIQRIKTLGEIVAFSAKKIESNDALMLGVVATYIFPFVTKASDVTWKMVLAIGVLVATVLWMSNQILPHPVLRLLNFRFYKVESSSGVVYFLLTERELHDPKNITKVRKISSSMLMEVL